jgi:preprotein translocase subunit SecD
VQAEILGGNTVVGFPTDVQARLIAALLRYGELPKSVTIVED